MKYTFGSPDSLVKELEIYTAEKDLHAQIMLPEGHDPAHTAKVKTDLEKRGFSVLADVESGKHILRVSNFESAEKLISTMKGDEALHGDCTVEQTARDEVEKKAGTSALVKAGALYFGADVILGVGEWMRYTQTKEIDGVVGAVAWAIPSVLLMVAGQQNPEIVNGFFTRDMKKQMDALEVSLPTDVQKALASAAADDSLWPKIVQTVYDQAPKINNVLQMYGGLKMSAAGGQQENFGKQLAGGFVAVGMGLGLVLPEHKQPKNNASHDLIGGAAQGVSNATASVHEEKNALPSPQKKTGGLLGDVSPLWFSGNLAKVNNYLNLAGAVNELMVWNHGKTWLGQKENLLNPYKRGQKVHNGEYYKNEVAEFKNTFEANEKICTELKAQQILNTNGFSTDALELAEFRRDNHKAAFEKADKSYRENEISAKAAWCNLAASGLYLAANDYYSRAHRDNSADIEKVEGVTMMLAMLANTIAAHPLDDQLALTQRLSVIMAENKHSGMGVEKISAILTEKVTALNESPWLEHTQQAANNIITFTRQKTPDIHITTNQTQGKVVAPEAQLVPQL